MSSARTEKVNADILADLTPRNLVYAYAQGIFPMVDAGELYWFSPDPRGLLPLDERFHVPRSLARRIRRGDFVCTVDSRFDEVVDLCSRRGTGEPTWISAEIRLAYGRLHELGLAHSVEAWPADSVGVGRPAGGLYGVSLGAGFFAESMFHRATDAGKAALVSLVERLREMDYRFCDIQWCTENLNRYGAYELPREDYLELLHEALEQERKFT